MKQGIYLAFVYIGLVIGAGFASGREIMQYFNFPSNTYHGGIVLATFLLIAVCYIILNRCYNYGISTFNEYLSLVAGTAAYVFISFLRIFYYALRKRRSADARLYAAAGRWSSVDVYNMLCRSLI